eukprot:scpid66120/ scgid5759/ Abhydrolase domain-containing protein 2; Lung alpha/beta hydrolase 2
MGCAESRECFAPDIEHSGSEYNAAVIERCPLLTERYRPPSLWGRNGHAQCIVFCTLGRQYAHSTPGVQATMVALKSAQDGTTITFDMFVREDVGRARAQAEDAPWVLIAPGICNWSQSDYVQSFVQYALHVHPHWRVAVLNHLGTDSRMPPTSARVFNLGCCEPFDLMVKHIHRRWPDAPLVALGFSMGANIILKYLGEDPSRQALFSAAVSCCQSYVFSPSLEYYEHSLLLRFYSSVIARRVLGLVKPHRSMYFNYWRRAGYIRDGGDDSAMASEKNQDTEELLGPTRPVHACNNPDSTCRKNAVANARFPPGINLTTADDGGEGSIVENVHEDVVFSSYHMGDLDRNFFRPMNGYATVHDYYAAMSSAFYLHKVTDVPVMLLNADDDPVAPPEDVYHHARTILDVNPRSLFVHTRHGSHMAYYSGGCVLPDDHNVFDQMLLQYITAVLSMPDR